MKFALSNLPFGGFDYLALQALPTTMGLEIFYEFGEDYYWDSVIRAAYRERPVMGLSLHGPCVGVNLAEESHDHYLVAYERFFHFAAKWDADFVVVHTNESYRQTPERAKTRIKFRLERLLALAAAYDVNLVIENVGLRSKETLLFDWDEYLHLLIDFPQAGALLDIGHAHINGWNLAETVQRLGTRLHACHVHDNDGQSDKHLCIGQGSVDWAGFFQAAQKSAADMTLVFEYANTDMATALNNIRQITE